MKEPKQRVLYEMLEDLVTKQQASIAAVRKSEQEVVIINCHETFFGFVGPPNIVFAQNGITFVVFIFRLTTFCQFDCRRS